MKVINPTGGSLRSDAWGHGGWQAPRGSRVHNGIDLRLMEGQPILMPRNGRIVRASKPYGSDEAWAKHPANNGLCCEVQGNDQTSLWLFLWYVRPLEGVIQSTASAGEPIAVGESVGDLYRARYPDKRDEVMQDHVHMELRIPGPEKKRVQPVMLDWWG